MKCDQAAEFVSALCDGERIPPEAAEHIGQCATCRARLKEYAEMGAELRRVASLESAEEVSVRRWERDQRTISHWWWKGWETMRIPRFAFVLLLTAVVGLGSSLVMVSWAGRGEEFQFRVASPGPGDSLTGGLDVGGDETLGGVASHGFWIAKFKLLGVANGTVHLDIQGHNFESEPNGAEVRQALSIAAHHVYDYVPGQTLKVPVEGGDTLTLVGKLVEKQAEKNAPNLAPNAVQITRPVLFRDGRIVADMKALSASASDEDSAVGMVIPKEGRYFLMLNPVEGAIPGEAYFGQVRFQLEGKSYLLASATAITGGSQPRQIWIYHDQFAPDTVSEPEVEAGDVSKLLQKPE